MFTNERIQGMIKEAQLKVEINEEMMLEAVINHQFRPDDKYKAKEVENRANRLAEAKNYLETLEAMLESRHKKADVVPADLQHQFARLLA
jgi:hypothetical protein